jgi:hypothetical protein
MQQAEERQSRGLRYLNDHPRRSQSFWLIRCQRPLHRLRADAKNKQARESGLAFHGDGTDIEESVPTLQKQLGLSQKKKGH